MRAVGPLSRVTVGWTAAEVELRAGSQVQKQVLVCWLFLRVPALFVLEFGAKDQYARQTRDKDPSTQHFLPPSDQLFAQVPVNARHLPS